MEFNEKLQELRRLRSITQEELAEALFVSRTAVSKWESGRGYPNIDSLKAIARFFNITIDELLFGDEILSIAEEESKQKEKHLRDVVFGLLDICVVMLLLLPFFGQKVNGVIEEVSLLGLGEMSLWLKAAYFTVVIGIVLSGIATLAMQSVTKAVWVQFKGKLSFGLNAAGVVLFIGSLQPYAATFLLVFLIIKVLMLIKWQ